MAGKGREIKGRIKAVGNIQRITKTMQMIATARFQAMQKRATSAQAYTRKIAEIVGELSSSLGSEGSVAHPLLSPAEGASEKSLLLVITSSRGLCGAYNANMLRRSTQFIRERGIENLDIEAVGKKAVGFFKFTGVPLARFHSHFGETPKYEDVDALAERYMDAFTAGEYKSVHVAYTAFESMSRQTPRIIRLLPLESPTGDEGQPGTAATSGGSSRNIEYDFSPDPEQLLADLLPITVKTTLFQCFNEAVVSEQLARMVAMKAATDAAGKMKKSLQRSFNRARQNAITTELTEIIGGTAALE
ncbi:ATP synthase F1 subunit gamma [Phycisphaerales bacterium AB-hyl4]|uniref:ATP synthase gamma chain n=1 Tax=Natronomicrosphaera hydrolytica TaxID=3242702 RepID=A0ABV4U628_9BACT